jgi:hypothetical protein
MAGYLIPLHVTVRDTERYSIVRGQVRRLTDATSIVPSYSRVEGAWLVRTDRVPELLVLAELQGGWVVRVHRIAGAA